MTKPADIAAMIKTAETQLGSCDILVNNAGIQHVAPIEEFPSEMGPDHRHQSDCRVPRHARRDPRHEGQEVGTHHLDCVGAFAGRLAVQGGLRHRQAWHRGLTKTAALELATFASPSTASRRATSGRRSLPSRFPIR